MKRTKSTHLFITLLTVIVSIICNVENMFAQERFSTYTIDDIIEQFTSFEEEDIQAVEELKENLSYLAENPIDINTATQEQLEQFPFLSPLQVENILFYIYTYGRMHSLNELRLVEDIDISTIQLLTMFVTVDKGIEHTDSKRIKDMFKYGKNEFSSRFSTGIEQKKGYSNVSDSIRKQFPGSYYVGSPAYSSVRYRFSYKDNLSIGFTAEKDPGEEFFRNTNRKGYDHYSFHFYLSDYKWIKTLAAGNYKASFGKGLVLSNDFYMGKSIYMANIIGKGSGIKKHSSTDEVNYLHGIAGTARIKDFDLSMFYSFRKMDGVVDNGLVSSLKKDGYHRLERDIAARNKVNNNLIGSNIKYNSSFFNIELTAVYNILNRMLKPDERIYNIYYPSGKEFFNASLSYNLRWKNIFLGGETATDSKGHIATLNSITFYPINGLRFFILYRYYDKQYSSLNSSSFASGGRVQNESGIFLGAESTISSLIKLYITFDSYRHPWLKYNVDKPSSGEELNSRITVTPGYNLSFYLDYRYRKSEYNYTDEKSVKETYNRKNNKLRLYCGYSLNNIFTLKTYVDYTFFNVENLKKNNGFALTQNFSYKLPTFPMQISAAYSLFDTDSYDSRIYITTKNLPYQFYFPSVYGKGMYFAGVIRYDFKKFITVAARYTATVFEDRETIGSGPEEISGNIRSDIGISLTLKF